MLALIKKTILDFIFPIYCAGGCGKEKTHCCSKCLSEIPRAFDPAENIIAAAKFHEESTLAEMIHRLKYDGAEEIGKILVSLFTDDLRKYIAFGKSVLVPVPLHPRRFRFRGFNQSAILAREISARFGGSVADILIRKRYTRPQVELHALERASNVKDAFDMKDSSISIDPDAVYFVVDDVYTTGATLNECASVLKNHGARNVLGLVVGRAV